MVPLRIHFRLVFRIVAGFRGEILFKSPSETLACPILVVAFLNFRHMMPEGVGDIVREGAVVVRGEMILGPAEIIIHEMRPFMRKREAELFRAAAG